MLENIIFLVLLSFIISQPSEARREEMRQRRREQDKQLAECILNNTQTSPELKKLIEENKDNIMKALHPRDHKLEKSDRGIIRNCRREQFDKRREEIRQRREQEHREHPNHDNL